MRDVGDLSAEYRANLKSLIDQGIYDHAPEFREAANMHLTAWDLWVAEASKLEWYHKSVWRFFILVPWYIRQSQKERKAYKLLRWTQDRLNNEHLKERGGKYEIDADAMLTDSEKDLIKQFLASPQWEAAISQRKAAREV